MTTEEIIQKKQHGDLKTAGAVHGISAKNAYIALQRPGSKYYERVKNTLEKVILMREKLTAEATLIN